LLGSTSKKKGNEMSIPNQDAQRVLVEGPELGDANFLGRWLMRAAEAKALLLQAKADDPAFRKELEPLDRAGFFDFDIIGRIFVARLELHTFAVDADSDELLDFCLMAHMGFFVLTNDRYQMVIPSRLDIEIVKQAHLVLVRTEDEDWIHPEQLIAAMPHGQAAGWQLRLGKMDQTQRLAERRALLSRADRVQGTGPEAPKTFLRSR
jgi:hypothetical protein